MTSPDQIAQDVKAQQEYAKALEDDWGQFVATSPILYDGVLAYLPGHAVPASLVKQYGYDKDGLVAPTHSTKKKGA